MNKTELIKLLAEKTSLSQKKAGEVLEAVIEVIKETLAKGDDLKLSGFGTFKIVSRKSRTVKIPGSDREVEIPEHRAVKFIPGKRLRERI